MVLPLLLPLSTVNAASISLATRLQGQILLQVQQHGEAWYVNPKDGKRYYMKDGQTAYQMMRKFGQGISEADYAKVDAGNITILTRIKGLIILRVALHGEAYYINPKNLSVTYLKDGAAAYALMRSQGQGIADTDLGKIPTGQITLPLSTPPVADIASTPPPAAPVAPVVPTPSIPPSTVPHFGSGTFSVGADIQPGTYRTRVGSSGCYYARLSGFGGTLSEIITNANTDAPAVITIAPTDKGFTSSGCGTWTQDLSKITTNSTSFTDGIFIIGTDVDSGTYQNSGSGGCYYSRLNGFGGTVSEIISNENTDASAIVTIAGADKGFLSSGCGTWTKK